MLFVTFLLLLSDENYAAAIKEAVKTNNKAYANHLLYSKRQSTYDLNLMSNSEYN